MLCDYESKKNNNVRFIVHFQVGSIGRQSILPKLPSSVLISLLSLINSLLDKNTKQVEKKNYSICFSVISNRTGN